MKYTLEELDNAIFKVIPQFKVISDNKLNYNRPMALKSVAEKYFIDSAHVDRRDFDLQEAYEICRSALADLSNYDHFVFS